MAQDKLAYVKVELVLIIVYHLISVPKVLSKRYTNTFVHVGHF